MKQRGDSPNIISFPYLIITCSIDIKLPNKIIDQSHILLKQFRRIRFVVFDADDIAVNDSDFYNR